MQESAVSGSGGTELYFRKEPESLAVTSLV